MRVISGVMRGHKLKTLEGSTVRPTSDRVKEAMFNILGQSLRGARVLDLFAGSGALGIEAISRGAHSVVFVDSNSQALNVLRQNLKHCKIAADARVIQWNIEKNLNCLKAIEDPFDLVFMDPPYKCHLVATTLNQLLECGCLASRATLVAEHEPGFRFEVGDKSLLLNETRKYGSTEISFLEYDQQLG